MKISFIAAMSENRAIGFKGSLPWHLPDDLKHFKLLTLGKHILMGRKTFASLKKPLPHRHNYVLTNDVHFAHHNVTVFHSKEEVLKCGLDELIVIGGTEIFKLFMPECEKIYLTIVHATVMGDAFFPSIDGFSEVERQFFLKNDANQYSYSFLVLVKNNHHV